MNNLKTMAALAAVMLAGLAAPMATANHGLLCPASHTALNEGDTETNNQLSSLEQRDAWVLESADVDDIFRVTATSTGHDDSDLLVTIYKFLPAVASEPARCVVVDAFNPTAADDYEVENTPASGAGIYFIEVEVDPLGGDSGDLGTDPVIYTIEFDDEA